MPKRQITATAPDGTALSINVGPKREVGAIRITGGFASDHNGEWLITVHRTLELAITGPNQTPAWNHLPRWAIAIGADDQATGEWFGASK